MKKKEIVSLTEYIKRDFYSNNMSWISPKITKEIKNNIKKIDYIEDSETAIKQSLWKAEYRTNQEIFERIEMVYNSINELMFGNGTIQEIKFELSKLSVLLIIVLNKANKDFFNSYSIDELIACDNRETLKNCLDNFIITNELKRNILISTRI